MMESSLLTEENCDYKSLSETKKDKTEEIFKITRTFSLKQFQMLYYLKAMDSFDSLPQIFKDLNSLQVFN